MAGRGGPGGSRKGIPNKIGAMAKANIIEAFNQLGGIKGMVRWARSNKTAFYKIYARLIPTEITGSLDIRHASELSDDELRDIIAAGRARDNGEAGSEEVTAQVH